MFTAYRGIKLRSVAAESAPLMSRLMRECVVFKLRECVQADLVIVSGGVLYLVVLRESQRFMSVSQMLMP